RRHPTSTLFPYTTLFRSNAEQRNENLRLAFIWDNKEKLSRIDNVVEFLIDAEAYLGLGGHSVSLLFFELNESQSAIAIKYLKSRSEEHTSELQSRENLVC